MTSDLTKPNQYALAPAGAFAAAHSGASEKITIAFLFDATASRSTTWLAAQKIQSKMIAEFTANGSDLEIGIIVHRGGNVETIGWFQDGDLAKRTMQEVSCKAGGTKIASGLGECLGEKRDKAPKAIIIVGDCCEEERGDVLASAQAIKAMGIPVHSFHEGNDAKGREIYQMVADATNGVSETFGPSMSLEELIRPLFVHVIQGEVAFQNLLESGDRGAQKLKSSGLLRLAAPDGP